MAITVYPGKSHGHHMPSRGTQVSCRGCRKVWFDGLLAECPECGWKRPGWNKWLRTSKLNNQLTGQVEKHHKNVAFIKKTYSEKPPSY